MPLQIVERVCGRRPPQDKWGWQLEIRQIAVEILFHKLCYTHIMRIERSFWSAWAQKLQRFGLDEPVATILEAAGPLTGFLAQFLYFGQPFFRSSPGDCQWQALAGMLENQDETRQFVLFLREEEKA